MPCYDTSLYMNGLHLDSDDEAAALVAGYAREDYEQNHRSFKIKVGRGALHMPLEAGNQARYRRHQGGARCRRARGNHHD